MTGGENYEDKFFNAMDRKNCKGIIFFISESFLLSKACAEEMRYFIDNHKEKNTDKFCLIVLPKDFPSSDAGKIEMRVREYVERNGEMADRASNLAENIELFLKLNEGGKLIHATLGDEDYIRRYCEEGQVFDRSAISFGRTETTECTFGYFPQKQGKNAQTSGKEANFEPRPLDEKRAYYAKVNWLVVSDNGREATLLSRDLLFYVNYLDLKYPLKSNDTNVSEIIKKMFTDLFKKGDDEKQEIVNVRFLTEKELEILMVRARKGIEDKRKVLLPKTTFFSQVPNSTYAYAFWLAGDMEDARRVDLWKKGLSDLEAGIGTFHVRIVVDVKMQ
jgi:hypothetical protein